MRLLFYIILTASVFVSGFSSGAQAQLLTGYDTPREPGHVVADTRTTTLAQHVPIAEPVLLAAPVAEHPSYRPLITYGGVPRPDAGKGAGDITPDEEPVDLQADSLSYDENTDVVSASGNVFMEQSGRILRADTLSYNVGSDTVIASGRVVLNETNGDVHLSDRVEYQNKLGNGTVHNLKTTLNDGSRFTAKRGERAGGTKTTMHGATYTPCIPCGEGGDSQTPAWAIRASKVTHDEEEARISYRNARFELWGVPVAYSPYFSHPDGSIEQKSGFLSPSLGYKSELGAFVETSYYWGIGSDQDATLGVMAMTDQAPLGLAQYRKRWNRAMLNIEGGITASDRSDKTSGLVVKEEDKLRGHVFGFSQWDINDKWRAGANVNWASDDQYVRQYDFTNEDVLESDVYAERFSGRNYASARLISFQDIRVRAEQSLDQPDVLPEIIASFKGEPGAVALIKGRWSVDASMLGLRREGSEQDLTRLSLDTGWKRRLVSDYGFLTNIEASIRGDAFYTNDRQNAVAGSGRSRSGTDIRAFPQVHIESSYPMVRAFEGAQARIEPVFALTAAPKVDIADNENIPNEDSNDVQIDTSNLFERNRFPGLDRVEDQTRAIYGLRSGLYGYDGSYGKVFVGQSYRFDDKDNPFPNGSGLDEQESDLVGQISGRYKNLHTLDYRLQLSSRHLNSERHEIDASADWNRFRLNGRYLYASALEGTELDQSREQIDLDSQFYVSPRWRVTSGLTHDFGENSGLRQTYAGLDYLGQCLFLSLTGEKNFTTEASGESDTEILFRVGLKNLGDFEESGYRNGQPASSCSF